MKKCPYCGKEYPDDATVCALDQEPLKSGDAASPTADSGEPVKLRDQLNAPEGYKTLGSFDPFEASQLLERFEKAGIRFLIEEIERRFPPTFSGFTKQVAVAIYVHVDDEEKANKILSEEWKM